jgi:hypothetical protein
MDLLPNYIGTDADIYLSALSLVVAIFACFKIAGAPRQGSRGVQIASFAVVLID